jgi:hypothetical protein
MKPLQKYYSNLADMYRSDKIVKDFIPAPKVHLERTITFDHCRFIPVKDGFKIYYLGYGSVLGTLLDEVTIPEFAVDAWEHFITSINDKIPTEKEVEDFLHNTFLKKNDEKK